MFEWTDKQNGIDDVLAEDINNIAHAVMGLEENANKNVVDQTYTPDSENAQSGKAVSEAVTTEEKRADSTFANALKGTKSGTVILLDDVSPATHEMGVRVRGKNLVDDTKRLFTGGAIFFGFTKSIIPIKLSKGTYTFSVVTADGTTANLYIKNSDNTKTLFTAYSRNTLTFTLSETQDILLSVYKSGYTSTDDVVTAQLELGTTATAYTPYVPDLTAIKVSKCGKNLLNIEPMLSAANWRKDSSLNVSGYWNYPITGLTPSTDYTLSMASNGWSGVADNGFYVCLRNSVGVFAEAGALCHTTGHSYYCNSKVTVKSNDDGMLYLSFYNPTDERLATFFEKCPDIILELGTTATDYEPYKECAEYTPNADGTVEGVTSLYPNTTLTTDTDGVLIDCEYNRDINKAFAELQQAVLSMGGNT